jgi:hypothetical protein
MTFDILFQYVMIYDLRGTGYRTPYNNTQPAAAGFHIVALWLKPARSSPVLG